MHMVRNIAVLLHLSARTEFLLHDDQEARLTASRQELGAG